MKINNLKGIIDHSMAFIEDDYTELWVVAAKVQEENPEFGFEELIEATKEVIQELVIHRKVKVFDMDSQEQKEMPVDEILDLVERTFVELNRMPNIGDCVWFTV